MPAWKTKATLPDLQGKGQQGYVNCNVSPCIGYVTEEEVLPEVVIFTESWGEMYSEPPTMPSIFTESWSS